MSFARSAALAGAVVGVVASGVASADPLPINPGAKAPSASAVRQVPSTPVPGAPLPNPMELIYTPITPCRAFSLAVPSGANQTRTFQISGSGDFTTQGGPASGCGVPATASAITVSLHANSGKAGYLTAFPQGVTQPPTSTMLVPAGVAVSTGASVAVSSAGELSVFSRYATLYAGDVTGYYAPQIQVYMNPTGTAYAGTTRVLATSKLGTGSYKIDVDRNLQLCSVHVNIDGGYYYGSAYPSGSSIYVSTWSLSGGTATAVDLYHNVSAKC